MGNDLNGTTLDVVLALGLLLLLCREMVRLFLFEIILKSRNVIGECSFRGGIYRLSIE